MYYQSVSKVHVIQWLALTPSFLGLSTSESRLPVRLCPWLLEPWVSSHIHAFLSISTRSIRWTSYNLTSLKAHECIWLTDSLSENDHEKLGYLPIITFSLQFPRKISLINWGIRPCETGVFASLSLTSTTSWIVYYIPLCIACFRYYTTNLDKFLIKFQEQLQHQ